MSWVKELIEEMGYPDVAEKLEQSTKPHPAKPAAAPSAADRASQPRERRRSPADSG
jgi:ribosomal protein L12E/L44/L45/RPP1/RPP2